jgi:hypothetical protein
MQAANMTRKIIDERRRVGELAVVENVITLLSLAVFFYGHGAISV